MNLRALEMGKRHNLPDDKLIEQAQTAFKRLGGPDEAVAELTMTALAGQSLTDYVTRVRQAVDAMDDPYMESDAPEAMTYNRSRRVHFCQDVYEGFVVFNRSIGGVGNGTWVASFTRNDNGAIQIAPESSWRKVEHTWALKSLTNPVAVATDDTYTIGSYGILFGSPDAPDISPARDFFTKSTDLMLDAWPVKPLFYDHDMNAFGDGAKSTIGQVVTTRTDDVGVWVEAQLNKSHAYAEAVQQLIESGRLHYSSDSASHLIERRPAKNATHELTRWGVIGFSLTPTPAEPRLRPLSAIKSAYQSLGQVFPYTEAKEKTTPPPVDPVKNIAESGESKAPEGQSAQSAKKTEVKPVNTFQEAYEAAEVAAKSGDLDLSAKLVAQGDAIKAIQDKRAASIPERLPLGGTNGRGNRKSEPMPFAWAVWATKRNPNSSIILRSDGEDGLEFRGEGGDDAVKAFRQYAETAKADIEGNKIYNVKAMSSNTATSGAEFAPRFQMQTVIEALYQDAILRSLPNANIFPMPALTCDAPTIAAFTASWTAQNAAPSSVDATTGKRTLTARKLTALATVSNEFIADSNPSAEAYIRRGLARAVSAEYDKAGIVGAAADALIPVGLWHQSGVVKTAIGTDNIFVALQKARGRMAANNVPQNDIVVICRPEVVSGALVTRLGSDSISVLSPQTSNAMQAPLERILGVRVFMTTAIPVTTATSWAAVLAAPYLTQGDRQELEIASSNVAGSAFANNQTLIRAIVRGDFDLQHAAACEIVTGIAH